MTLEELILLLICILGAIVLVIGILVFIQYANGQCHTLEACLRLLFP